MKTLILLVILVSSVRCLLTSKNRDDLVNKSNTRIRPSEKTTVEVAFVLTALNKLDSVKQELGTTFLLYMTWTDPKLAWTPGGTYPDSVVFYVNEIWTPPLVVSNAIDDSMFLLRDDIFPLRVNYNGTVTWIPRLSPTTTCEVDTSIFPIDTQVCDISITSWVHSTDELTLVKGNTSHYPDPVNLDFYTADKAWELIKTSVEVVNLTGGYGIDYHQVNYRFHFRRHERFYWVLLVIPGICLAFLQPLVFLIPLNAQGTRLSYATTMLLSFIFYTSILTSVLPPIFGTENEHVFGESFGNVMICGTVVTGVVILEIIATSIIKKTHPKDNDATGIVCLGGKDFKDCKKCIALQLVNGVLFLVFLIVYSIGINQFRDDLKKEAVSVELN